MTRCLSVVALVALAACASSQRAPKPQQDLLQLREESDRRTSSEFRRVSDALIARVKSQHDQYAAGRARPPVIDVLIISGGGDWGAFGSAYLKGWGKVPKTHPLARPQFDVVTGVSTGALIAPFAFIGTDEALERVVQLYRNPQKDWVRERRPLSFLPNNISFAKVPGLERELRTHVTMDVLRTIADAGKDGRMLVVNTTNLDQAGHRVFDLVAEARRAIDTGSAERVHNIMLASAGIPAAFPHREIDGEMYVDGGVTGNIVYGGRVTEEESFPARWQQRYPGTPIPKIRFWVIFNNQARTLPQVVNPRWPDIVARSLELSSRSATLTAMRHLHALAEISRLKRKADVEVRIVAVPDDWSAPQPGVFIKETMNALADLGEKMGADPASWRSDMP